MSLPNIKTLVIIVYGQPIKPPTYALMVKFGTCTPAPPIILMVQTKAVVPEEKVKGIIASTLSRKAGLTRRSQCTTTFFTSILPIFTSTACVVTYLLVKWDGLRSKVTAGFPNAVIAKHPVTPAQYLNLTTSIKVILLAPISIWPQLTKIKSHRGTALCFRATRTRATKSGPSRCSCVGHSKTP